MRIRSQISTSIYDDDNCYHHDNQKGTHTHIYMYIIYCILLRCGQGPSVPVVSIVSAYIKNLYFVIIMRCY